MTNKQKDTTLFILGGLSALAPFSIDMYLPAFPSIAKSLGTDISMVTLSLTSYFIGISIGQLFYGPITDKFGRKKPLLFGLGLFFLASIGCAIAPSIHWLIFTRIILALGGCVGMVVARAIVRDLFPVAEIAKIFSILMLIVGVAPVIAPTIGGWVVMVSTWRTIFYILSGIGLLLFVAVYFFLAESKTPDLEKSLHVKVVLNEYLSILKVKSFLFFAFAGSIASAGMFAYISGSSFVFIKYFGLTAAQFGIVFAINAMGFISGSQLNRVLLNRFSSLEIIKKMAVFLFIISLLMGIMVSLELITATRLVVLLFMFLLLLGILVPNCTAMALIPFKENAGSASALIGFIQMFCGATFSAFVSVFHNETLYPMIFGMLLSGTIVFGIIMQLNSKVKKGKLQVLFVEK